MIFRRRKQSRSPTSDDRMTRLGDIAQTRQRSAPNAIHPQQVILLDDLADHLIDIYIRLDELERNR